MISVFDPKKDPARRLTLAYVLAFIIIAGFMVSTHFIVASLTMQQKEMSEISYMAGRQRMLLQQIVLFSSRYNRLGHEEDRVSARDNLEAFEQGHAFLTRISKGRDEFDRPMNEALYGIYYTEPYNLDMLAKDFIKRAREYTAFDKNDPDPARIAALDYMSMQSTGALLEGLDQALQSYQRESMEEIRGLEDIQSMAVALVLVVLLLEALLIFRPLVRHVKSYSRLLLDMALHDPLTGLNNRRAFMERAEEELNRAVRHGRPYCVVLADLDKFKAVNDTHGHEAGDMVLKHFAAILKDSLRAEDIVGRVGGEEFALFLPETPGEKGLAIIERLRQAVEESPCQTEDGPVLFFTSSFGFVANDSRAVIGIGDLLKAADKALYEAKGTGRNRVVAVSVTPQSAAPVAATA